MSSGGSTVWRERVERDPMAGSGTARGRCQAQAPGRRRHSQRIEAHAELILSAVAAKSAITLAELQEGLKERAYITAMLRISITAAAFEAIAATLASASSSRPSARPTAIEPIRRAAWAAWAFSSSAVAGAAQYSLPGHSRLSSLATSLALAQIKLV